MQDILSCDLVRTKVGGSGDGLIEFFSIFSAQKAGFLSEAHHEEVDQADPFYAHCKVHSDKTLIKNRKRNFNTLLVQIKRHEADIELKKLEKPTPGQERIERKLKKHRIKYTSNKTTRIEPWGEFTVPANYSSFHKCLVFSSHTKNAAAADD